MPHELPFKLPKYIKDKITDDRLIYKLVISQHNEINNRKAELEAELTVVADNWQNVRKSGNTQDEIKYRTDKQDIEKWIKQDKQDYESLKALLSDDARMENAFKHLENAFGDNDQEKYTKFIYAAWQTKRLLDAGAFKYYRTKLNAANKLKEDITKKANELAALLRKAQKDDCFDNNFWYIANLLNMATPDKEFNKQAWETKKRDFLFTVGDVKTSHKPNQPERIIPSTKGLSEKWIAAPQLPELLDALVNHAKGFELEIINDVGVAIKSREDNDKQQFIRTFAAILNNPHSVDFIPDCPIDITADIKNAIMETADIFGISLTYRGVSKALEDKELPEKYPVQPIRGRFNDNT